MEFHWGAFSPVVSGVLVLLVGFSAASWTVIVFKTWQLARWQKSSQAFTAFVWQTEVRGTVGADLTSFRSSPLVVLYQASKSGPPDIGQLTRILRRQADEAVRRIESPTTFLATTAATTPFIGLFGTVWGIMEAFGRIGQSGSTSLVIVAPGISEALVATAVGLAVAIPAVIGYNALQGPIRRMAAEVDHFCDDLLVLRDR